MLNDGDLTVGRYGRGTLHAFFQGELHTGGEVVMGDEEGAEGTLLLSSSTWHHCASQGWESRQATVTLARSGRADVTIENGGSAILGGNVLLAENETGIARVTVVDAASALVDGTLTVARLGDAIVNVDRGAMLRVDGYGNAIGKGDAQAKRGDAPWQGSVSIDGPGSRMLVANDLTVGDYGNGTVSLTNHGELHTGWDFTLANGSGTSGQVTLAGGSSWFHCASQGWEDNDGNLIIGVDGKGEVRIEGGSTMVSNASYNVLGYSLGGTGVLQVLGTGSRAWFAGCLLLGEDIQGDEGGRGDVLIGEGATIEAGCMTITKGKATVDGTLRTEMELGMPGLLVWPEGELSGSGRIIGDVWNFGVVSPGDSPGSLEIFGDLTMGLGGSIEMEIAGIIPGIGYDQLEVTGTITLAGGLDVLVLGGYLPQVGYEYVFLTAGAITGSFEDVEVSGLGPGWSYDTRQGATDYRIWFSYSGAGNGAIPEPCTMALLAAGLTVLHARKRCARRC